MWYCCIECQGSTNRTKHKHFKKKPHMHYWKILQWLTNFSRRLLYSVTIYSPATNSRNNNKKITLALLLHKWKSSLDTPHTQPATFTKLPATQIYLNESSSLNKSQSPQELVGCLLLWLDLVTYLLGSMEKYSCYTWVIQNRTAHSGFIKTKSSFWGLNSLYWSLKIWQVKQTTSYN